MNKTAWGILIGIGTFISIVASVYATSSYWHGYCATEKIHEFKQDEKIILAVNQSTLAILQQRMTWLEQRIWELEKEYACANPPGSQCNGTILRTYKNYLKEYRTLQEKISKLLGS